MQKEKKLGCTICMNIDHTSSQITISMLYNFIVSPGKSEKVGRLNKCINTNQVLMESSFISK